MVVGYPVLKEKIATMGKAE